MPNQNGYPARPDVTSGQIRRDKRGATIIVAQLAPDARYVCEYPQLEGETSILSEGLIAAFYPIVVSE